MLISLIILFVVAYLAYWIITTFFPEPIRMISVWWLPDVVHFNRIIFYRLLLAGVVLPAKLL